MQKCVAGGEGGMKLAAGRWSRGTRQFFPVQEPRAGQNIAPGW